VIRPFDLRAIHRLRSETSVGEGVVLQ
jgi:hypothetical protein